MKYRIILTSLMCLNLTSCNDEGGGGGRGAVITSVDTSSVSEASTSVAFITPTALNTTELFDSTSVDNNCVDFTVTTLDISEAPVSGAEVNFNINFNAAGDTGTLTPESVNSGADGTATTTYCSGVKLGEGTIVASVGALSTNSDSFIVTKKGVFEFKFTSSTVKPKVENESESEAIIGLNLIDSGPIDCTTLYFDLSINGTPVSGRELVFSTQYDPPRGVKLAKKADPGVYETDTETGKTRAIHTATSSSDGRFAIPFCAGVSLGSAVVSAGFVDEDGNSVTASSPVVSIKGGVTNYINYSLTFDTENARTLKGYFNTNSPQVITTQAKLDTRGDGDAILDYPLQVMAETGKATLIDGGRADESGAASFTMQALHMVDNYAYRVFPFLADPEAAARCEPAAIANSLGNNPALSFSYLDLSQNWRSTVTYAVRGQEHYYDENRNGVYDANGDGFWDKNQNGVFDGDDVLTFDNNNNGVFDYTGEWFIDLPSPFVDADENGVYDPTRDKLLGETYVAPNGVRDADTIIWKDEFYPIYMGSSPYAMRHESINGDINATPTTNEISSGVVFQGPFTSDDIFGVGATEAQKATSWIQDFFFYLHGICGNLVPGGSTISGSVTQLFPVEYGERKPSIHFYPQPGDYFLEPSRRFLRDASGQAESTVNFNAADHPRREYGYPIDFNVRIPACSNSCEGDLVSGTSGVSCPAQAYDVWVHVKEPDSTGGASEGLGAAISFDSTVTCQCVGGAFLVRDTCTCPEGTSSDGANCIANP